MWRRVCTRAPATADIFYSFEVERKKKRNAKPRGNKNTKSRPRQSAKAATGACVGGCTKNSIVRGDAIDRSGRSIDCVRSRDFRTFRDRIERSIHVESIIPLDSFECATYKVHVHFDSTRIIDGTDDGITQLRAV